jgi:tRNA(Ile)-lysidine synthase
VRRELIPILESYNPQVRSALWRMARSLAADEAVLESSVDAAWRSVLFTRENDFVSLDLSALRDLPEGLRRRVLIRSAESLLPAARDLDFDAVERGLWAVDRPGFSGRVELVQGLVIFREGEYLVISRVGEHIPHDSPQIDETQEPVLLPASGEISLPGGWTLSCELVDAWPAAFADQPDAWEAWLDVHTISAPLVLRCSIRGERFQPLGMQGHSIKLSDFWTNQKIPRRLRAGWPLVVCGDQIAWIPGLRLAHPFQLNQNTRRALHLRLFRV